MGDHSFPKSHRLLKRGQFLKLSQWGKKFQTRFFIAIVMAGETDRNRIGITVSKKVGNAVVRNRIKRFVREYYRGEKETIPGKRDINIIARKYASHLSGSQIFSELDKLFKKMPDTDKNIRC